MYVRPRAPGKLPATGGSWQAEGRSRSSHKTDRDATDLCDSLRPTSRLVRILRTACQHSRGARLWVVASKCDYWCVHGQIGVY
jgi:hypothetical protein